MNPPVLDRRIPTDFEHVEKYPLGLAAVPREVPTVVETMVDIPRQYRDEYDQGQEGACVGYSQSWLMSILNRRLYDAFRLYATAQGLDEYPDTPPAGGTSLRAGFDVLRTIGHWRIYAGQSRAPQLVEGIVENRWIRTVQEARLALHGGMPLNLGINWYRQFSNPTDRPRKGDSAASKRREYWLEANAATWGPIDGGHAITAVGASDAREAFALCNTWGTAYPFIVWLPYVAFEKLMQEYGECGVVTDRIAA